MPLTVNLTPQLQITGELVTVFIKNFKIESTSALCVYLSYPLPTLYSLPAVQFKSNQYFGKNNIFKGNISLSKRRSRVRTHDPINAARV